MPRFWSTLLCKQKTLKLKRILNLNLFKNMCILSISPVSWLLLIKTLMFRYKRTWMRFCANQFSPYFFSQELIHIYVFFFTRACTYTWCPFPIGVGRDYSPPLATYWHTSFVHKTTHSNNGDVCVFKVHTWTHTLGGFVNFLWNASSRLYFVLLQY